MGLSLEKKYREKVVDEEKVENGYNIEFVNGEKKFFISKGVIKAIKSYIDENIKDIAEVEAEELTEEEKKESIEIEKVEETTTAISVLKQEDIEILQKIIAEYKARMNNTNTKTKTDDDFEFDYKNIEIPSEVRKINIDTTLSIRGNKSVYEKIREVATENGISASLLVNYLFYSFLKTIKKW
jgi:hypothetical protein